MPKVTSKKKVGRPPVPDKIRILRRLNRSGPVHPIHGACWLLTRRRGSEASKRRDSRWVYSVLVSSIPNGLHVLHKCDNPSCVNPSHLFLGTDADNAADRNSKNRQSRVGGDKKARKGQNHPRTNLLDLEVIEMRRVWTESDKSRSVKLKLASTYRTSERSIQRIVYGTSWRHLL
jgi:hypothetical protein